MSGRPGTVVGCGCNEGIGFDASGFGVSGGAAGLTAGWSPACCAKAGGAARKAVRVPAIKMLGSLNERVII
jgi:hypothetical protein